VSTAGNPRAHSDEPVITEEMIARRAFEISLTHDAASPDESWLQAERELREELERQRSEHHH
jgi:hypothetical protein